MSGTDYRTTEHDISYELPSPIERLAAERLAQSNQNAGPIDLTHNVVMDEIPD